MQKPQGKLKCRLGLLAVYLGALGMVSEFVCKEDSWSGSYGYSNEFERLWGSYWANHDSDCLVTVGVAGALLLVGISMLADALIWDRLGS
jgi:hypothetical protein